MATPVERAREAAKRWGPSDSPMSRASRTAKMPVTITEAEYKWQTQQMDRQRQQTSRQLNLMQAQIKVLQGRKDKGSQQRLKMLQAQQKSLTGQITSIDKRKSDLTTKYYTSTGQYEKLLKGADRDAFTAISALFKSYGLSSLAGKIFDYVKNGYSGDTISILLQDTPEYKQRFAGNEERKKMGLPVLSPAEYLATEASYEQIMRQAGLPAGFYDQHSDFVDFIGKNISPSEIQSRVDLATQATTLANPDYRKALNQMGISDSDMTAYFLDPNKALPHLQKSAATAAIGAEALHQGLAFDQSYSEQLATAGISQQQAQAGYQQIAGEMDTLKTLGQIYGDQWTQRTAEQSVFEGEAGATAKKGKLLSQERGAFSGATGGARAGLGQQGGAQ